MVLSLFFFQKSDIFGSQNKTYLIHIGNAAAILALSRLFCFDGPGDWEGGEILGDNGGGREGNVCVK